MERQAGSLLSVNVGLPRDVSWQGRTVHTGVWKEPVDGPAAGPPAQHRRRRPGRPRRPRRRAARRVRLPDRVVPVLAAAARPRRLRATASSARTSPSTGWPTTRCASATGTGSARRSFEVTQPRVTCYRVGIRMDDPRMPALLVAHHRPGFYLRVLREGEVRAGDEIVKVAARPEAMTVAEVDALLYLPGHPRADVARALRIPALRRAGRRRSASWPPAGRRPGRRQRRAGRREPAARLAGVPPAAGDRDRAGEPSRDLAAAGRPGRGGAAGRAARAVP